MKPTIFFLNTNKQSEISSIERYSFAEKVAAQLPHFLFSKFLKLKYVTKLTI